MKKKFIGKKGISSFISVIIIVAMVIAVGVFVISWTDVFTKETVESVQEKVISETACNINTGFDFWRDAQGYTKICLRQSTQEIEAVLENKGNTLIENVHAVAFINETTISAELNMIIAPGGVQLSRFYLNTTTPELIQQVEFTPAIKIGQKKYWCSDSRITVHAGMIETC